MKSKRFWFRSILILGLSVGVLGSLIAASPAWISDWIFRTGQTVFSVYNSSTQLIETVDNRNKARRQYGALTVDGTLYANGAISATGAISTKGDGASYGVNIGTDTQLYRSAANVITTPDSIVSATHTTVSGDMNIGGGGTAQKLTFQDNKNYKILNVANYYNISGYTGMLKIVTPIAVTTYLTAPNFEITCLSYSNLHGKANVSSYYYTTEGHFHTNYSWAQTEGYFPYREIIYGIENGKLVIVLSKPFGSVSSVRVDLLSSNRPNASSIEYKLPYSIVEISDLTGITDTLALSANTSLGKIFSNGVIVGTNKTALTSGYVLDVSGAAYVSGTIYGAGNISGATFTDRTPGSPEDAIKEIETWKVVGDQVDHASLGDCAVDIKEVKTGFEIVDKAGNVFNSIEEKVVPAKGSKETDIQSLSDMVEKVRDGIAEVSAGYQVKEVSAMVETKGRNISKTISTLSRAIQQLSERLDKLEGK